MKTVLDNRELQYEEYEEDQAELTLGTGSLLAIFFGVVLLCGLCFGFGYSVAHRKTPVPTASEAPSALTPYKLNGRKPRAVVPDAVAGESAPEEKASPVAPAASTETQSADAANPNFPANYTAPDPDEAPAATRRAHKPRPAEDAAPADVANNTSIAPPVRHVTTGVKPRATATPADQAPLVLTAARNPLMVQIAAVSRQEDADVLATALRRRGFSPMVRHGGADAFYHVQVGPFAEKAQADSMKERLLAQGYNAILK